MSAETSAINERAKELVAKAKSKGLVSPISAVFKNFPVEKEIHKGRMEYYSKRGK